MFLGDDSGVELDICRRSDTLGELGQIVRTSYLLQLSLRLELIGNGEEVDWLLRQSQLIHYTIDQTVLLLVERSLGKILLHLGNLV